MGGASFHKLRDVHTAVPHADISVNVEEIKEQLGGIREEFQEVERAFRSP